ncbi:MAG TPA: GNAT family N-acetyltransferase [Anaerolineales bacterium]|nr:GNAT family N-acetyltransferase [Anaerolineales bacterium]
MLINESISDRIELPIAPAIPGLIFRHFRGEADFPGMVAALNASEAANGVERVVTVEEITSNYAHLNNCDLSTDLIIVEIKDEIVGYCRTEWWRNDAGERIYVMNTFLKPEWRRKRIGTAMLGWGENHLREIAAAHPADGPRFFDSFSSDTAPGVATLLMNNGYLPIRYGFHMVRPDLENTPDFPFPPGLEVRPVTPDHYRAIWDANNEAFRDHWGFTPPTEADYNAWLNNKVIFTPEMWKIAWDVEKNEVAGQVKGFINHEENKEFKRLRGYCEFISTRRPYRKQGVARALIALTLREFKARGMTEAALGVDAQNPNGAVRVYEACGFRVAKRFTTYRKPLEQFATRNP